MFDVDDFVQQCRDALVEPQPVLAVKEILERAVRDADAVETALPPTKAQLTPLHVSPELTVLEVVWGPGMSIQPHNHLMWAAIGLYGGQEDNVFYRRSGAGLVVSGGKALHAKEVVLLGDDTIHAITNPLQSFAGALHVYGGDLTTQTGRSEWDPRTLVEHDYDFTGTLRLFEETNRRLDAESGASGRPREASG